MPHKAGFLDRLFPHMQEEDWLSRLILVGISVLLAVVLPVLMVFSTRSSAALLVIASVLFCFVDYRATKQKQGSFLWRPFHWLEAGRFPFILVWVFFGLLAFVSILDTLNPLFHARRLVEFLLPVFAAGAVMAVIRHRNIPVSSMLLAIGITLAALLSLLELQYGAPFRQQLGLKPEPFRLNRTMVTIALLMLPLFALAIAEGRIWLAYLAIPMPLFVIYGSESGAAAFGLILGLCGYLLARFSRKLASWSFLAGTTLIWLLAPWHGAILAWLVPQGVHARFASTASSIRVEIYRAFGYAVEAAPLFGAGFNTAAQPLGEPAFDRVPQAMQHYILYGHPHNAALQLWVELGFVGALFALALTFGALRMIASLPARFQPLWYAFFAACFSISIVSHGAWQAWWVGNIGICLALLAMATRLGSRSESEF
jgi:O-antigen ligase